jgi:peptidoglycan/xylan/chitin deacetylase (PgdA/CDA1 family)
VNQPPQRQRIPVLMYHRVGQPHDAADRTYCIEPAAFRAHMRTLADAGCRAISTMEFVAWLDGATVSGSGQPFVITFDDGFAGLHEHALPVLREIGWPAAVFLVAGQIGGEDRWALEGHPGRPLSPLLGRAQIDAMAQAGFEFHSHSMNHRSLRALGDGEIEDEVAGSRERLHALLGRPVDFFAYPYGHHDERVVAAVKAAGYRAAFSVLSGFNRRDVDRYRIRRLDVFGTDTPRQLLRKFRFGTNDGSLAAASRYYWRQLLPRLGR